FILDNSVPPPVSPSPPHLLAYVAPLFLPPQAPLKYSGPATS
ncbi:unnamed protein product, partial [Urochloa humidicola]